MPSLEQKNLPSTSQTNENTTRLNTQTRVKASSKVSVKKPEKTSQALNSSNPSPIKYAATFSLRGRIKKITQDILSQPNSVIATKTASAFVCGIIGGLVAAPTGATVVIGATVIAGFVLGFSAIPKILSGVAMVMKETSKNLTSLLPKKEQSYAELNLPSLKVKEFKNGEDELRM